MLPALTLLSTLSDFASSNGTDYHHTNLYGYTPTRWVGFVFVILFGLATSQYSLPHRNQLLNHLRSLARCSVHTLTALVAPMDNRSRKRRRSVWLGRPSLVFVRRDELYRLSHAVSK